MGFSAVDLAQDMPCVSGAWGGLSFPTAIYQPLVEKDPLEPFSIQRGSGGDVYLVVNVAPSGGNIQSSSPGARSPLEEAISEIRATFGLTKASVADVLLVTRKTLYNWIDRKTTPQKEAMSRIYDLLMISKTLANSGINFSEKLLHTPIVDDKNIFELLSQEELNKDLIYFAGTRLALLEKPKDTLMDPFI